MKTLINNATVVSYGVAEKSSIIISDGHIHDIIPDDQQLPSASFDQTIDAEGCYVFPGVIDSHVHFRDPGLTDKADIESESRAAAAGGVTSFFDMPNTKPQTTTRELLEKKYELAKGRSLVNYAFFIGATNDNIDELLQVDPHTVPGVKLFMGSSTGNMLVDDDDRLEQLFSRVKLPIMAHCEDTAEINRNMEQAKAKYGEDPDVSHHPEIRSERACIASSAKAENLAVEYGARVHIAHVSTERELELFSTDSSRITAEACIGHLMFCDDDYARLGSLIKVNPAIKSWRDRSALRRALWFGKIKTVATDHAPHRLEDKQGGCAKAASGMPAVQFSLPAMLQLVDEGVIDMQRLVELMCHNPAKLFEVDRRGFIRKDYKADLVIVKREAWTVDRACILSKCGWSPFEGMTFNWKVVRTICNGHTVYADGKIFDGSKGERITFRGSER